MIFLKTVARLRFLKHWKIGLPYSFHFVGNSLCSAFFKTTASISFKTQLSLAPSISQTSYLLKNRRPYLGATSQQLPKPSQYCSKISDLLKLTPSQYLSLLDISPTFTLNDSSMSWDSFILPLKHRIPLSLDLHNLIVKNKTINRRGWLFNGFPLSEWEIHVAGGYFDPDWQHYCDGHCDQCWRVFELLEFSMMRFNPTLINWKGNFQDLHLIEKDLERINKICRWPSDTIIGNKELLTGLALCKVAIRRGAKYFATVCEGLLSNRIYDGNVKQIIHSWRVLSDLYLISIIT